MNLHERERAIENKYAHDQEVLFKIIAKRNKLLGFWAADQMKLSPSEAENYANTITEMAVDANGLLSLVDKILHDLTTCGADIDIKDISQQMFHFESLARKQILG